MDSEDDMHDANDVESMDDDEGFYSDEMGMDYYGSDDDVDVDFGEDNEGIKRIEASRAENNFIILKESDIKQRQEEDITSVSTVLSISRAASSILLRYYNWSVSEVHEAWFADEDKVRKTFGLLKKPVIQLPSSRELTCGICFEAFHRGSIRSAACGHPFCCACWEGYIRTSISDGPGCLILRCPDPSCGAAVGQDMITMLVSDEDNRKYSRYLLRSYIENNKKTKWCPAPGCDNAVNFVGDDENYDVSCLCSYGFCWNCTEEAHRPVDCSTVSKWIMKNSAESENMNWILANSKPCPKCKRPIEKNQGCMHMTCTPPCKFEFCWLCLGAWSDHGERTGGFYACNRYEAAKQEGVYDETERRREMAKNSLERYTHYYERWASNQLSRQKALADLHQMRTVHMEKLSDIQREPESQLKFITDAWQQIVECRRVLKWTYAYGYYLPEQEHAKRQFFEYLQGEAESGLERLHQCAEKELQQFLSADGPSKEFIDFRRHPSTQLPQHILALTLFFTLLTLTLTLISLCLPQIFPPLHMKTMRFLLSLLPLLLLLHSLPYSAAARKHNPHHNPINSSHLVRSSCSHASYPNLCIHSLSTYAGPANTPRDLAQAAVNVSLSRARRVSGYLAQLSNSDQGTKRERSALSDCIDLMSESVDELTRTLDELKHLHAETFRFQMSNAQTWVSAALTDDDTCLDGFEELNVKVKADMKRKVTNAARVTSNALYLINRLDESRGRPRSKP